MNEETEFELAPETVLEIKDRLLKQIEEEDTGQILMGLMAAMVEVIVTTGPNLEGALHAVANISVSMAESIKCCDEAGLCNWNSTRQ